MNRRTIVIGDVHGCIEELDELLRVVQFQKGTDRVVMVGDLVDRGPDSLGVVRRARELELESCVGNHEDWYLRYRKRTEQLRRGEIQKIEMVTGADGAEYTHPLQSKLALFNRFEDEDWDYLEHMPSWIFLDRTVVVVHAGFEPAFTLAEQRKDKVCRVVYVDPKSGKMIGGREAFRKKPVGSIRWAEAYEEYRVIYGHAVFSFETPLFDHRMGHTGIDTGCYAGGRLTAWIATPNDLGYRIETAQVQAKHVYMRRELAEP